MLSWFKVYGWTCLYVVVRVKFLHALKLKISILKKKKKTLVCSKNYYARLTAYIRVDGRNFYLRFIGEDTPKSRGRVEAWSKNILVARGTQGQPKVQHPRNVCFPPKYL